ncbi:hypothetical protein ABG067_005709 [Albugo candida]|uniref:1,3-beta-glucan synthase n=1 Tax=Albugo candida TaxID=65357 RepID=A0A024FU34_9STRA|nr:unnamed protein product [Albugo candida]|eukprot:CCI10635.1 unnamed protein product [Albugo candida]
MDRVRTPSRRRADSNYFELDADRRRTKSDRVECFSQRIESLNITSIHASQSVGDLDNDEISIDSCCNLLHAKFGFQEGSIANQREHVLLLLANAKARTSLSEPVDHYINQLHAKLFSNYKDWCQFLTTKTAHFEYDRQKTQIRHPFHMEIMLYFLIWGEGANLRHMPECLCYIYHKMLLLLNERIASSITQEEGWFLNEIVRPIWKVCSNMQRRNTLGKPLEHVQVCNYDDINEYFWKSYCLQVDVTKVGYEMTQSHGKTFYEHRSIFTFMLNYYRIFQFNFMFLLALIVLAFAVTISPNGGHDGFTQFGRMGDTVSPFTSQDLGLALLSLPFGLALLCLFKCLLELAHTAHIVCSHEPSSSSSRSFTYFTALWVRILWHSGFSFLLGLMIVIPFRDASNTKLLDYSIIAVLVYLVPGIALVFVNAFHPQLIYATAMRKFVREGNTCYVGRRMTPPLSYRVQYTAFWLILWTLKAIVSYFILVRPLMLPSLAVFQMKLNYKVSLVSFSNIGVLVAYWAPSVFIFNYDTQIYFTIFQALLGAFQGWRMKTGEIRGEKEMSKAFRLAPQLFDQKIVTGLARSTDATANGMQSTGKAGTVAAYESQMMLRFVVVWNEIVNSFREGDLLDDKEAAILQYDIRSNGEVFEPVFLSAGKLSEASVLAIRAGKEGKGESQFQVSLVESDCLSAIRSFFTASWYVLETLFGSQDGNVLDGIRMIEEIASNGAFMRSFMVTELGRLRVAALDVLEDILDLPDPDTQSTHIPGAYVHNMGVIRNFVSKMDALLSSLDAFCTAPELQGKFLHTKFCSSSSGYVIAAQGLVNLYQSDVAMGAATRACLLLSLDKAEAMPRCLEARRRLGFFMKSLVMEIPQLSSIREMRSFSVVTPFYAETVLFSIQDLNNPLVNHPIFQNVEEGGKNLTILKYLNKIHPEEWENFLERIDVGSAEEAQQHFPQEIRLWASYRGQTLARTVQGMMLYEEAIKILHWLEIGSGHGRTAEQKQQQLQDMVRLKFSYVCACQVYGKHRAENQAQADDIDYLLKEYPNLRVAYVDTLTDSTTSSKVYDSVLIKSQGPEIVEVYRFQLPGDPIIGEGKPENQNNAVHFTRGEFVQTIDMNQQHYFEECLKMPQLLRTAELHPCKLPVSIIGMREHIFTGNASSLAKFKTWQELVFVTLSQRVLATPLFVRMHYGHPDIFDKVFALTRGGLSKASKGINLSEDVFAGFNATLRGGVVTHVEFMQCGKGRDVALSQISMFEGKLANGAGETSLAREAHRMGQFMDFFRLNSMYYSHTGFYFATWMTIVTTFVYMYSKVYVALAGVQEQVILKMNSTDILTRNEVFGFPRRAYEDSNDIINTQYYIQAGLFLSLPLVMVYFGEMGIRHGFLRLIEMIITGGPFFFIFQVGTTMHYFDNNLVHGEAQYKATGRGFKITRELYVLLYKAYSASHFRRAFELIGLCLIYWIFGDFHICQTEFLVENSFAADFCETAQGFGVQTFAIWTIAITWILAPFLFNTDGLDFEKTKADVRAWATWMYAEEDFCDQDGTMNGGWIGWWKNDLKLFHNSRPIARFTVILRESRHFLLMWYIITLRWQMIVVGIVAGFVLLTLVCLRLASVVGGRMREWKPRNRLVAYCLTLTIVVISCVLSVLFGFDADGKDVMALFFGYMAGLYGLNETARMYSFASTSIAFSIAFQQLAFLFDFLFCSAMIIPLFVMSGVPFLNIIQTRMMYNKGFSQVVSASSQYAFSLAAFMGILGGGGCGWILYVFSVLESSPEFISYATNFGLLDGKAGDGTFTYVFFIACIVASLAGGILNFFCGRRLAIVCGGLVTVIGMICITAAASQGDGMLLTGVALMGSSIGIVLPTIAVYVYEISTREVRSKSLLILGTGFILGTLVGTICMSSNHEVGWVWQIFVATIALSLVTPSVYLFPESPYWIYMRHGLDACERCLIILRRKEGVTEELKSIREETLVDARGSLMYKLSLGLTLVLLSGFSHGGLTVYMSHALESVANTWDFYANCIALQLVGAIMSFFVIDRTSLRRLLLGTLFPIAISVAVLGFYATTTTWSDRSALILLQVVGLVLYFFIGLGTSTALWVSCIGLFPTKQRAGVAIAYFMVYFSVTLVAVYVRSNYSKGQWMESIYLFVMAGMCLIAMALLFGAGDLKNGLISTKREMESEQLRLRRTRSGRPSGRSVGVARSRNISRSRNRSQVSKSGYQLYESPAASAAPI